MFHARALVRAVGAQTAGKPCTPSMHAWRAVSAHAAAPPHERGVPVPAGQRVPHRARMMMVCTGAVHEGRASGVIARARLHTAVAPTDASVGPLSGTSHRPVPHSTPAPGSEGGSESGVGAGGGGGAGSEPRTPAEQGLDALRQSLQQVTELHATPEAKTVAAGTVYSPFAMSVWNMLRALVFCPAVVVPSKGGGVFGVQSGGQASLYAFTSTEAAAKFISEHCKDMDVQLGQMMGRSFADAINEASVANEEGVDLVLDAGEPWSVHLDAEQAGTLMGQVIDTVYASSAVRELSGMHREQLAAVMASPQFAESMPRILGHDFHLIAVKDDYLGEMGVGFMTVRLPRGGDAADDDEDEGDISGDGPWLATPVFSSLLGAAEFLHYHGPGAMAGKDPALYRLQAVPISGRELLRLYSEGATTPAGRLIIETTMAVDPPAIKVDEVDMQVSYFGIVREVGRQSGDMDTVLSLINTITKATDTSVWVEELATRGMLRETDVATKSADKAAEAATSNKEA